MLLLSDRSGLIESDLGGRIDEIWWLSMKELKKGGIKIIKVLDCTAGYWVHQRERKGRIDDEFVWVSNI